jgi:predicted Zn-dependent protease
MTALGVPPRIWEHDPEVDDLSIRFRNTAWAFVLAHELGHLLLGHMEREASPSEIQRQEEAADAFAVDLLARSDTIPMGMILRFQATAGYLPNRSDFPSEEAYFRWLRSKAEHPVNGRRMRSLAEIMHSQARGASDPNRADTLEFIAERLARIGEIVEDPEMQGFLRRCAELRRPEELARLHDSPCL